MKLNTTTVSDAVNPPKNVFNSSIAAVGVPFPFKNPNYINQLGFDANFIRADGILANGATSAVIRLTTGGETYFPGAVAFATDLFAPQVDLVKSVQDLDGGQVEPGDVLRYRVTATNSGGDDATNVVIEDPIPTNTTYAPGTLTVDGTVVNDGFPGSDRGGFDAANNRAVFWVGAGAVAQNGGTLAPAALLLLVRGGRVWAPRPRRVLGVGAGRPWPVRSTSRRGGAGLLQPARASLIDLAWLSERKGDPLRVRAGASCSAADTAVRSPNARRNEDEFVGVAVGQFAKASDADGLQAGDDSRPAERDREHHLPCGRRDHRRLKRRSMLANSRLSDSCWDSNSSSGMSGA